MRRVPIEMTPLERFGSRGVTIHHPTSAPNTLLQSDGPATLVIAALQEGGVIGRHPATGPQLMIVAAGTVRTTGGDGEAATLCVGESVLFEPGEHHETRAITDATIAIQEWVVSDD